MVPARRAMSHLNGVLWSPLLSALVCLTAGWSVGRDQPALAVVALAIAGCTLALMLRELAAAERLAAKLSGLDSTSRPRLARSLARLALNLESFEQRLANSHPVTELPTREHLAAAITADCDASRAPQLLGVIRFVDFDRLAAFDQDGANSALRTFARRLMAATKPRHVIAQIDRDCFAVWFRQGGDHASAEAEFRAITYVARQEIDDEGAILIPTIESGVVVSSLQGSDAATLLLRARAALRTANGIQADETAAPASIEVARSQFALEQSLARAIPEGQLAMVFQPVVDLSGRGLIGAEALLRWEHPTLGPVSPARFIPVVEAIGLSEAYGLWVLNAACREAKTWRDGGLGDLKVAVNLSARQLLEPELRTKIERTLKRHGLAATALELELTETAAMVDAGRTLDLFSELRAMGVTIAIDDFGTGYSSLSYLKNLPFDKLKIDREFVTDIDRRRDSQAICKSLIELCRGLDLQVLAEGVENAREVETLRSFGCQLFQGFHFSRPLTGDDFRRLAHDPEWRARLRSPRERTERRIEGSVSL